MFCKGKALHTFLPLKSSETADGRVIGEENSRPPAGDIRTSLPQTSSFYRETKLSALQLKAALIASHDASAYCTYALVYGCEVANLMHGDRLQSHVWLYD